MSAGAGFFISDKQAGLIIAKKIQEQYGGTIKQSSKNIGMKDSRQVYRMTYLLRLPSYTKGDFISYNKSFFYILSTQGNRVKIKNLSNWEITTLDVKTIQKAKILGGKELVKEMILVSQKKDEVQVMDPKTYKIKIIRKPKPVSFDSKMIKVVKFEDKFFLES